MTKEEYLYIKDLPFYLVSLEQIREAEKLIKETTLARAKEIVDTCCQIPALASFLNLMLREHYGTVEVDELLMSIRAYPDCNSCTDEYHFQYFVGITG